MSGRVRGILRSRLARVLIASLVSLLILGLSLTPKPIQVLRNISHSDKIEHAAAYLVLAFSICWAFGRKGFLPIIISIALCAAYGGIIEIVQPYVERTKDLIDFVADAAGATTGAMLCGLIFRKIPFRPNV